MGDSIFRVLEFLDGPHQSFWLESVEFRVLLRRSERQHPTTGVYARCLNVAYVEVSCESTGAALFGSWLDQLIERMETPLGFEALYLEGVSSTVIAKYFRDRGWLETRYQPSSFFFKL